MNIEDAITDFKTEIGIASKSGNTMDFIVRSRCLVILESVKEESDSIKERLVVLENLT